VHPVGGQPALCEDQHQRAQAKRLRKPGIIKGHTDPGFAEREAQSQEQQQAWQADPMRHPRRGNRRDHHSRADEQDET
jgi:hypothetical protein